MDKTLQDQYIEVDALLRAKAESFGDDNAPTSDDIAEMHTMQNDIDTLKVKMELAAIKSQLVIPAEAEVPAAGDVGLEDAVKSFMASPNYKTKSREEFHVHDMAMKTLFTTTAGWTPRAPFTGIVAPSPQRMPCLLYTSPSPRDRTRSRMPSSA